MFDYQCFLDELRQHENPEKQAVVLRRDLWSQALTIVEEPFFREYLSHFSPIAYHTPEELEGDYDFNLLLILVAASFSSSYELLYDENEQPELLITVSSADQSVTKQIFELWSFQILKLFHIYLEEIINIHSLLVEDEFEAKAIQAERDEKVVNYKSKLYKLKLEKIKLERTKILQF